MIEKDFRAHPAIVAENTLFMLTERVDPRQFEGLSLRVQRLEKESAELRELKDDMKDLRKRHNDFYNEFRLFKKGKS